MDDSRDLSWLGRPAAPPPTAVEQRVITLVKGARVAAVFQRVHPLGPELVCRVGDSWIWSRVIRPPDTVDAELAETRRAFEERGWTLATDPPKR